MVEHVITANHACLLLWGLEAVSSVDSHPIVSAGCAEQGHGEMTLVWHWYGIGMEAFNVRFGYKDTIRWHPTLTVLFTHYYSIHCLRIQFTVVGVVSCLER